MEYLKLFENHSLYEDFIKTEDFVIPNVSHCVNENDVHYNPKNTSNEYLTFEILTDGTINWKHKNEGDSPRTISYSLDNGQTWNDIESTYAGTSFNVVSGDKVLLKGTNDYYGTPVVSYSELGPFYYSSPHCFAGSTASFNISGNILSLFYGDEFMYRKYFKHPDNIMQGTELMPQLFGNTNVVSAENLSLCDDWSWRTCYGGMFADCTNLITPPKLPNTVGKYCYSNMFNGCTSLTTPPELPATTLEDGCYNNMFKNCTSLTTPPELPATSLAIYCYSQMFMNCTSLTTTPELPVTKLVTGCYRSMFLGCTSLTTAPELPATTLIYECYSQMFSGCTSLVNAPELPATTLANNCYRYMFNGCTSLNYIKAMFTTTPSGTYTDNWVKNVASTGTFVKNSTAQWNVTGVHGIPTGWTVETAN